MNDSLFCDVTQLVSELKSMPGILRFLTAISLASGAFVIATILPGGAMIGDRSIGAHEWWTNGSGVLFTLAISILVASGVMILKRARFSRECYLLGFLLLYPCAFAVQAINEIPFDEWEVVSSLLFGVAQLTAIALYFYVNRRAKEYFSRHA